MQSIIFDLDDHSDAKNCLPQLIEFKKIFPKLKATLFTIPDRISKELLIETKKYDWIQMAVHGFNHGLQDDGNFVPSGNVEFAKLNYEEAKHLIEKSYDPTFYVNGFKAPGWQISVNTMIALKDLGMWVAVQFKDGHPIKSEIYQPPVIEGLPYYAFDKVDLPYYPIHGHTWDYGTYKLADLFNYVENKFPKETDFVFINDYMSNIWQRQK